MRIGLTYDLKSDYLNLGYSPEELSECDSEETIATLAEHIASHGHEVDRIGNIKNLCKRLANDERWDLVFNFAEGMHGSSREAQVPSLLEAYQIPYTFSNARLMTLVLDKALAKGIVRESGVPTPDYWVVKKLEDVHNIPPVFPLFAKPIAEGSGKGVYAHSKISNKEELEKLCWELLERFNQPVLVEKFLSGREVTVGIIGTGEHAKVLGVLEIVFLKEDMNTAVYGHAIKQDWLDIVDYQVLKGPEADHAAEVALKAWQALGGLDCGRIDIRFADNGVANFIELNTIPGLSPVSDIVILSEKLGLTHADLIGMILESYQKRQAKITELKDPSLCQILAKKDSDSIVAKYVD